ncbi:class I SAM-dependent methyltransferase [Alicyclobacillus dauci]|uniref:Class I SAM-dependent methyltransferase n=1 Tax=Alicyclobacillus dauci TaxID=1475485 RepID=A0ABY6YZ49_9BACL|nr:hypothetical protein [Alicyclobacillus dauci]WAH35918.1 class I SAM-dependent methyltransferase [Alicyclobacillus dauci]
MSHYKWDYFKDVDGLRRARTLPLTECVADMKRWGLTCYVPTVLPNLPFADKQFDLTLSAHFLFTYAERLDYDFHIRTIKELARVTREEIRIFPTVDMDGNRYSWMI